MTCSKSWTKSPLLPGVTFLFVGPMLVGPFTWTYEVLTNRWFKGSSMNEPRCLFSSASTGKVAFVADGFSLNNQKPLNSAEKYDPITQSWVPLPNMKVKRKKCVGYCLDDKFYVIGGQGENENVLTCGEVYDESTSEWKRIPGILNGLTHITSGVTQSPPLVAVANNELYIIETSTNCLMVYRKDTNSWTDLGPIPLRADISKGWGVAFKSLGNELLVIGGSTMSESGTCMSIYTCCPNPNDKILNWKLLDCDGSRSQHTLGDRA